MTSHRTLQPAPRHASRARFPGPRDALDSGSVSELVEDSREVRLAIARARPWPVRHHDIVVPSTAPSLLDGLGSYGS
jgi:hypothetical protein